MVRFPSNNIQFPEVCPICKKPSTKIGIISSKKIGRIKQASYHPRVRKRYGPMGLVGEELTIRVPVCDSHEPRNLRMESRAILVLISASSLAILIFGIAYAAFLIYDGYLPGIEWLTTMLIASIALGIVFVYLGPSKLGRKIQIIHDLSSSTYIVLRIHDEWYLNELLFLNPSALVGKSG